MKWVNVLKSWEAIEDSLEFLCELLCREFDFADVKSSDSGDLETSTDLGGQSSLGATEDDVEELGVGWNWSNVFPGGLHCGV